MTLGAVKAGDIVLAERHGWRFHAIVRERRTRELVVQPIDPRVSDRVVAAREVIGIWHQTRARDVRAARRAGVGS